jgi:allantoicase
MVEACDAGATPDGDVQALAARVGAGRALVHETPLQPHARHRFTELAHHGPSTHVRLNIYPDGGIARMRLFGLPVQA